MTDRIVHTGPFLGLLGRRFSTPPLGRYVTGVITANWKKSVLDLQHQTDVISLAADFIIQQLQVTPKHLLTVTTDNFCSVEEPKAYTVYYPSIRIRLSIFLHSSFRLIGYAGSSPMSWDFGRLLIYETK